MTDNIDRVAAAICQAMYPENTTFEIQERLAHGTYNYRRMAQAAIDALDLREETRPRGLYRGDDPALKYVEARLAGPWVRVDRDDDQ